MTDPEVSVSCGVTDGGWRCIVRLELPGGGAQEHEVRLDRATLADLAPSATPELLVAESFRFLLERELASSILRSFELPVIGRYFADFPDEIRRRLRG